MDLTIRTLGESPAAQICEGMIHECRAGRMHKGQKEGFARLFVGFVLNIPLYFVFHRLVLWSTIENEIRMNLIGGCLAVATVVFVAPVFWRAAPWQAPIAFVLIFFLPGFVLSSVVATIVKYW
jgi:hypothetical protein